MPVNTAALKTFAPAMRRQLLEAVGRKLDLLLNSQTPDTLSTYAKQIAELREQEAENRDQLLERVAYTWFNRLCALRYLDARGWHPFGCKVLMPAGEGETQPELLKLMRAGSLPASLKEHTDEGRLHGLLDGKIQTAIAGADPQGEVYRELVLATCRFYHDLLPNIFEGLDDASELLLPDELLSEGSIAGSFRREIGDDDCQDVEILGWLYQFYIAEKKDEVMARKKAVPTQDIPAVTQLFTPHWIVRYLVENSLGRLWLLNRPSSKLRDQMPYYIEGEAETDFPKITKPEEIKILDPACGSGHILAYAFDLLSLIFEEEGYSPSEIPALILRHNLHGLEICPRAAQLAVLALVFKAREKSRRFFQPDQMVQPSIVELKDVGFEEGELNNYIEALDLRKLFNPNLFKLLHQFREAKNLGSLIQPCLDEQAIADVYRAIEVKGTGGQLLLRGTHLKALRALKQAMALAQSHHVVVANPPYMGGRGMNPSLKQWLANNYPDERSDLMTCFMERSRSLTSTDGYWAMINLPSWMFLSSYATLREKLVSKQSIRSLLHLGRGLFGPDFGTAAFIVQKRSPKDQVAGIYRRLFDKQVSVRRPEEIEALFLASDYNAYSFRQSDFRCIPGCPIAYWVKPNFARSFRENSSFSELFDAKQGLATGNNERFLRFWHEVSLGKLDFSQLSYEQFSSDRTWFPYSKGGEARKWYGNHELVINWEGNGKHLKDYKDASGKRLSTLKNLGFLFVPAITWSLTSISGILCTRYRPGGFVFDTNGMSAFPKSSQVASEIGVALLNSVVGQEALRILNPTMAFQSGDIDRVPIANDLLKSADNLRITELIDLAKADWDSFETSWDFSNHPFLRLESKKPTLEAAWRIWEAQSAASVRRMQELETENNRLFIATYGLGGELEPDVPEEEITLTRAEKRKDIAAFLSYATGCIMGRYSIDQPGLILADSRNSQAEQLSSYEDKVGKPLSDVQFKPDADAIIPVLDGEWFEDDIVARTREFLEVTFPESSVTENLRFIEESLGKDIRKYFCTEFYKDHLQTYKKRPIYWMVQSPKKGFACLIYLHRYTKDTLNQVLNNYFRPYLQKLEARLAQLGLDQLNDSLPTRERTAARKEAEKITKVLKECQAWEQDALLPLAQQRIDLDLDDGVKVNYLKLQGVLATIPGLAAKED
jgi:type II restriction/modification system DNA methylase subunit YeeA